MRKRKKAYLTVFLALIMAVVLTVITTLIELARIQTIRFQTEGVMDLALSSVFSEYHRELLNRYGLFYIDTSYGSANMDSSITKSHLLRYMNRNFSIADKGFISKNFTAIHADNADFKKLTYASDHDGEVLKYQIIKYMEHKKGGFILDSVLEENTLYEEEYNSLQSNREASESRIDQIIEELNAAQEGEEEEENSSNKEQISLENPADELNHRGRSALLQMALSETKTLSTKLVNLNEYISHRDFREGDGLFSYQKNPSSAKEKILFQEYIQEQCGNFQEGREGSRLDYQWEYLIYGKNSDQENLEALARDFFTQRYVINMAHLFSSAVKQGQAFELALTISSGIAHPELAELIKLTILFAWGYAESVQDLRILLDGKRVAFVKNESNWNIAFEEIFIFASVLDQYHEAAGGMNYTDYCKQKLFFSNERDLRLRLMDIMEMDIRQTMGNKNFRMDACLYQMEAEIHLSSKYGSGYDICRKYSYE